MKKLSFITLLACSFATQAYTTNFNFDVFSDRGDMFVCGASVGEYVPTDRYAGGDFLTSNLGTAAAAGRNGLRGEVGISHGDFSFEFGVTPVLTDLDFKLGSELYGSNYDVTICFEAATFASDEGENGATRASYSSNVASRIISGANSDYVNNANVRTTVDWNCEGIKDSTTVRAVPNSITNRLADFSNQNLRAGASNTTGRVNLDGWILTKCTALYSFREATFTRVRDNDQQITVNLNTELYRHD